MCQNSPPPLHSVLKDRAICKTVIITKQNDNYFFYRFIAPIPEDLVHFDLDVTGGDWLTRLEEHVSQADLPEDVYRFLCCLRPSKDEKDEEKVKLM